MKHIKTQDGVQSVCVDLHDIIEDFLKSKNIHILDNIKDSDILYDKLLDYIDDLAGSPDYSNYN